MQFRSTDYAGRHSDWAPALPTAASTVKIERTAPSAPVVSGSSTDWRDVASATASASGSTDSGGSALNHYEYQASTDNGSTWSALASGASLAVTAEGTTLVRFQAVDGAGNRSGFTQAQISIDRSLPTPPTVTGGSYTWVTSGSIEIDGGGSTDSPGSGVAGYQYRTTTNGGTTWTTAQTGASDVITADGETIVQFRSVDGYGHFSAWAPSVQAPENTARIDTTPPNAPTVSGGGTTWHTTSPWTVSASATDSGSGIAGYEYETSTDGGATWSSPTSGASAAVTTEGTSLVQFHSIDNVGNVSGWTQATVKLDSVAPTAPALTGGGGSWFTTSPQSVSASASTDATSGVASYQYQTSTDNVSYGSWTAGSSLSVSAQGTTYVRFHALDAAGNAGSYTQTTVKIDTVLPTAPTVTGGGNGWFTSSPQSVSASGGTDATSGVASYKYQTSPDNSTWSGALAGPSVSISTQGTTYVRFASVDGAGNTGPYSASVMVKLDTVAPTAPTLTGGGSSWFKTAQTVSASASTDATSGVASYQYQTSPDNTTWSSATAGSSVSISTVGTTYVRFAAVDTAGNVGSYATSVTVKFDNVLPTAPTVSGGSLTCSTSSRTIAASASTDANSGFLRYEYQISTNNGTTWGSVTSGSTVTFSAHGVTSEIQYRSVDNAGNVSAWTPGTNGATNTACVT